MAKIVSSGPSLGRFHKIISGFFQGRRFQVATISFLISSKFPASKSIILAFVVRVQQVSGRQVLKHLGVVGCSGYQIITPPLCMDYR